MCDKPEIEFITTDEMLDELGRRFTHCIFYGVLEGPSDRSNNVKLILGNQFACVGLAAHLRTVIEQMLEDATHDDESDGGS
jgi:hypothetical protein